MLHSKIMGRAHREDTRKKQKFFGGEYAKTSDNVLVYVNYSVFATSLDCPRWNVYVTTQAPLCTSNLHDSGSIYSQDELEFVNEQ